MVNPVPRTYARAFGALPFRKVQNIHALTWGGFLWYGVKNILYRMLDLIS